jgi:hypothetical protein
VRAARGFAGEVYARQHRNAVYLPFAYVSTAHLSGIRRWKLKIHTTSGAELTLRSSRQTRPNFGSALRLIRLGIGKEVDRAGSAAASKRALYGRCVWIGLTAGVLAVTSLFIGAHLMTDSRMMSSNISHLSTLPVCGAGTTASLDFPCLSEQPAQLVYAGPDPNQPDASMVQLTLPNGGFDSETLADPTKVGVARSARSIKVLSFTGTPVLLDADGTRLAINRQVGGGAGIEGLLAFLLLAMGAVAAVIVVIGVFDLRVRPRAGLIPPSPARADARPGSTPSDPS